jgi:hypothetical protein
MTPKQQRNFDVIFLTLLSFLGLLLIALLTAFPPNVSSGTVLWQKPLVGSIFSAICVLGVLAALSPTQCLRILESIKSKAPKSNSRTFTSHTSSSSLQGHHPRCEEFSAHVFRIGNKTFCAACMGLLLGGLFVLCGALFYFFGIWFVAVQNSSLMVVFGILGVGLGFFQFKFRGFVRLLLNMFFVLGTLLILIGVDVLVHSLMFDLFVVSLILFWLLTRISISQWDHQRICLECNNVGCELAD